MMYGLARPTRFLGWRGEWARVEGSVVQQNERCAGSRVPGGGGPALHILASWPWARTLSPQASAFCFYSASAWLGEFWGPLQLSPAGDCGRRLWLQRGRGCSGAGAVAKEPGEGLYIGEAVLGEEGDKGDAKERWGSFNVSEELVRKAVLVAPAVDAPHSQREVDYPLSF